jgi:WD40 repeat protein
VVSNANVESIAVIDADGTDLRQSIVDDAGATLLPAWSPDGVWIAFFAGADGSSTVSLIHPDGSGRRTLNMDPVSRDGLAWSPDPQRLRLTYKAVDIPRSGSSQGPALTHAFVKVYDVASGTETRIAETSILSGTGPAWSPDGTRISWWDDGVKIISVADAIAGRASPWMVFPSVDGSCSEHADLARTAVCGPAQWSPDSRWLFGWGIGGTAIVFGPSDGSQSSHAILLEHPGDLSAGQVAWQAVVP